MEPERREVKYAGVPASPGVAIGTAFLFSGRSPAVRCVQIPSDAVEAELANFNRALEKTREQIAAIQDFVIHELGNNDAKIFEAQLLIMDDHNLIREVVEAVRTNLHNCDFALHTVVQRYVAAMGKVASPYIRERMADIQDVANRIIVNIHGSEIESLRNLPGQRIIVSHEITPSDTAMLDRANVQALATETGSRTSHAAIIARSMKIPAVVAIEPSIATTARNGDLMVVDGFTGVVIVNPTAETLNFYARRECKGGQLLREMRMETALPPETLDGYLIDLAANIELVEDVAEASACAAHGIGLYRTEYLYLNRADLPSEEEQFVKYKECAVAMDGKPVVIRTLDVGGDKLSDVLNVHPEDNPFLGFRAIRLCLGHPDIFKTQMRAILRASAYGDVRIMFPMIACKDELTSALAILDEAKRELRGERIPFSESMEVGIMVETPAAALLADRLAAQVDFFSIGTNDLVQYTMAADRNNERLASLYQPTHPAIVQLIKSVCAAARRNGIWVGVCGEMASDPLFTPVLLGVGVQELSMSPVSIGPIRRLVRRMRMHEAEALAERCLACHTAAEAKDLASEYLRRVAPDVFELISTVEP